MKQLTVMAIGNRWFVIAYAVGGAVVAGSHGYFEHLAAVRQVVAALLALALWPLLWWPGIHIY